MSPQFTAPYQRQLLEQRASLLEQLSRLRDGQPGRAAASVVHYTEREADSRAQMDSERNLEFALDARESAELAAIDAALQRIKDGVYGYCLDCGANIAAARLQATPEATRCLRCQQTAESHRI